MILNIKNLSIINLNEIINIAINETNKIVFENNIKNQNDKTIIFKHFFYFNFLDTYSKKEKNNLVIYYKSIDTTNKILIKTIKFLRNSIKFPFFDTNISIEAFVELVSGDNPHYDEIINNNFNLIDSFHKLKKYIKTAKLTMLDKKYSIDSNKFSLLLNTTLN